MSFETRLPVRVDPGPGFHHTGRNATDASLATKGGMTVGWQRDTMLEIWVKDEGPGLFSTANLFVPFFTTKLGGSGISLVLSRQTAEGHSGTLSLENRIDGPGCVAACGCRCRAPSAVH